MVISTAIKKGKKEGEEKKGQNDILDLLALIYSLDDLMATFSLRERRLKNSHKERKGLTS